MYSLEYKKCGKKSILKAVLGIILSHIYLIYIKFLMHYYLAKGYRMNTSNYTHWEFYTVVGTHYFGRGKYNEFKLYCT